MRKRQRKKILKRAARKILNGEELTYEEARITVREIARAMRTVYQVINRAANRLFIGWKVSIERVRHELERKALGIQQENRSGRDTVYDDADQAPTQSDV